MKNRRLIEVQVLTEQIASKWQGGVQMQNLLPPLGWSPQGSLLEAFLSPFVTTAGKRKSLPVGIDPDVAMEKLQPHLWQS